MEALMVLVVEDEVREREALADCIAETEELRLVGATGDEAEALQILTDSLPDAMILDLALDFGNGEGLSLLRRMKASPLPVRPYILVTTSNSSETVRAVAHDYGADYVMSKYQASYSARFVVEHLRIVKDSIMRRSSAQRMTAGESSSARRKRLAVRIAAELDQVGINPKMLGYRYLEIGIRIQLLNPSQRLCAAIGAEVGKTEQSVERAIKNAIDHAWGHADDDALSHYTAWIDPERGIPTTTEFICFYANKLRREYE